MMDLDAATDAGARRIERAWRVELARARSRHALERNYRTARLAALQRGMEAVVARRFHEACLKDSEVKWETHRAELDAEKREQYLREFQQSASASNARERDWMAARASWVEAWAALHCSTNDGTMR